MLDASDADAPAFGSAAHIANSARLVGTHNFASHAPAAALLGTTDVVVMRAGHDASAVTRDGIVATQLSPCGMEEASKKTNLSSSPCKAVRTLA